MSNKIKIIKQEQELINTFMKAITLDVKDMLLINVAAYILSQNKLQSINLMNSWAYDLNKLHSKTSDEIYSNLTEDQKKKSISKDRYLELFGMCLKNVKSQFESILGLTSSIIIN